MMAIANYFLPIFLYFAQSYPQPSPHKELLPVENLWKTQNLLWITWLNLWIT
jgi:hypothetical protein